MNDRDKELEAIFEEMDREFEERGIINKDAVEFNRKWNKRKRDLTGEEAEEVFILRTKTLDDIPDLFDLEDDGRRYSTFVEMKMKEQSTRSNWFFEMKKELDKQNRRANALFIRDVIKYGILDDLPVEYTKWHKYSKKAMGRCYIKFGRCCFTCRFREKRTTANFVTCKHNNQGKPIWDRASCAKYRLTLDKKRLSKMESHVDKRFKNTADRWPYIRHLFKKTSRVGVRDNVPIKLGRCCFLCAHQSEAKRNKVHCTFHDKVVWDKATCRHFKLTNDPKRLAKIKPQMKKTGLDVRGNRWMYGK